MREVWNTSGAWGAMLSKLHLLKVERPEWAVIKYSSKRRRCGGNSILSSFIAVKFAYGVDWSVWGRGWLEICKFTAAPFGWRYTERLLFVVVKIARISGAFAFRNERSFDLEQYQTWNYRHNFMSIFFIWTIFLDYIQQIYARGWSP